MSRSLKLMTILAFATLSVAACGKRGALETPASTDGTASSKTSKSNSSTPTPKDGLLR